MLASMRMVMFSIIVPYKNSERWIGRCCDSLTNQRGEFEFILINDDSDDNGEAIVNEYANRDERFVMLDNQHRTGVSGARNTGLDCASGEWISFLDADDEMMPDVYKIFTSAINKHKRANIFQFNHYRHYAKNGKTLLRYTNHPGVYDINRLPVLWVMVWNKLVRRDIIDGVRFDEGMKFAEDEMFVYECLARDGRIFCMADITTTHHFENTSSLSKTKDESDIFKLCRATENFIKRNKEPSIRRAACLRMSEHWSHLFLDTLTERK